MHFGGLRGVGFGAWGLVCVLGLLCCRSFVVVFVVGLVGEEIGSAKIVFVVSWLVFAMAGSVYIVRCWTVKGVGQ